MNQIPYRKRCAAMAKAVLLSPMDGLPKCASGLLQALRNVAAEVIMLVVEVIALIVVLLAPLTFWMAPLWLWLAERNAKREAEAQAKRAADLAEFEAILKRAGLKK